MLSRCLLLLRIVPALGLVALLSTPAAAFSRLSSSVQASGPGNPHCSVQDGSNAGAAVSVVVSHTSCPTGGAAGGYLVAAQATAGYGTLRAVAQAGYTDVIETGPHLSGVATGQATFTDDITLDVPGRAGEVVELVFFAALNGASTASIASSDSSQRARASGGLGLTVAGVKISVTNSFDTSTGLTTFSISPGTVQVTLGQSFQIQGTLTASAEIRDASTSSIVTVSSASALAPFGTSGGPTSFELFDLGGAPITGHSLTSGSGQFQFFVPEPGLGLLLGAALAAAGFRRKWSA